MTRLNVSIRGTRQYARTLFRQHAGERTLVVMRDRRNGCIRDVRTDDGRIIYRPKYGLEGVIANVEVVMDHHVRVNVHIRL